MGAIIVPIIILYIDNISGNQLSKDKTFKSVIYIISIFWWLFVGIMIYLFLFSNQDEQNWE